MDFQDFPNPKSEAPLKASSSIVLYPTPSQCPCPMSKKTFQVAILPASITPQRRPLSHPRSTHTHTTQPIPGSPPSPTALPLRLHGRGRQNANLLDQKLALVDKLLVLGAVLEEVRQELQQAVPVHN